VTGAFGNVGFSCAIAGPFSLALFCLAVVHPRPDDLTFFVQPQFFACNQSATLSRTQLVTGSLTEETYKERHRNRPAVRSRHGPHPLRDGGVRVRAEFARAA
jgi:hypothetical protein